MLHYFLGCLRCYSNAVCTYWCSHGRYKLTSAATRQQDGMGREEEALTLYCMTGGQALDLLKTSIMLTWQSKFFNTTMASGIDSKCNPVNNNRLTGPSNPLALIVVAIKYNPPCRLLTQKLNRAGGSACQWRLMDKTCSKLPLGAD